MIVLYYKSINDIRIADSNDAIDDLYYQRASIPTQQQVEKYLANKSNIKSDITEYFNNIGTNEGIILIKKTLSAIESKIPLYDIFSQNLYIISKLNVYNRVVYHHYRFPTERFMTKLRSLIGESYNKNDILERRRHRKFVLMLAFLESFDLDILYRTYTLVFYLYANEVGKNITQCKRPSFLPHFTHIQPYYSRSEVINLALNIGIRLEDKYYEQTDVDKLCDDISSNDISSDILLKHQQYIINQNKVGLVQYYTLQGSYFINQYLRRMTPYQYKNEYLESIITPMWRLLEQSPAFDKPYTLYRFISNDNYLKGLNIGDMYTELGFTSTTRDPFYRSDLYKFGFILVKIKIPRGVKGTALCIETLSHFPTEQEIILPPLTILRLDKRDKGVEYYHTDENFRSQIRTLYEFTYIGKRKIQYLEKPVYYGETNIDFLRIETVESITLEEKIRYFTSKYLNPMYQFRSKIGDNEYTIIAERYDSTGAYSKYYAVQNQNGFSMYTLHNNYILFMIEIGEHSNINSRYMHVNYYVKYSVLDREKILGDENFIKFISSIAHYFNIGQVIIWADYKTCDFQPVERESRQLKRQRGFAGKDVWHSKDYDPEMPAQDNDNDNNNKMEYMGGSYCVDFYIYLKDSLKKFMSSKILNIELQPKFSYHQLDKLARIDHRDILRKDDPDEIWQIYEKVYTAEDRNHNIADFYIWMADNKCYLMDILVFKMDRYFKIDNPFLYDYYILDPITFLYNRNYIQTFPSFIVHDNSISIKDSKNIIQKNEYRINNPRTLK